MAEAFTVLETNILKSKGLSDDQIAAFSNVGINSRDDFKTVGDVATLRGLIPDLEEGTAQTVLEWALGHSLGSPTNGTAKVVVESPDAVYCIHCGTKQPKDYESGDLCISCGKQAEPILSCYWCGASGPGRFCRNCGAQFVPMGELDLAIHLKREGIAKDQIPSRLAAMSEAEKEDLWGRVRRLR
ncbi:MAG: hypothetical protein BGO01_16140 [Armatimonadetes bacterium 55-13]|nr:hypothetical protein [Armatimonadota bacterium]OJU54203.1 MAG: hypothetical protein BGN96_16830 [Bacteroidales bacterium 45-6]OJU65389.1 MAG: hypothetical protein BGO01_16140 [Armatimonadetes bacterium 55-13]